MSSDEFMGFIAFCVIIFLIVREKKKKKAESKELANKNPQPVEQKTNVDDQYSYFESNVAGVTFYQPALQRAYKKYEEDYYIEADIEEYEYKGEQAFRILCFGKTIGNIPRHSIKKVASIYNRIVNVDVDINEFENDEGETILRADVSIKYRN